MQSQIKKDIVFFDVLFYYRLIKKMYAAFI